MEHTGNPPDCSIRPASGGWIDPIFPNFQRGTDRFDNQRVTRFEVLIEAAHGKASFLHQVRDDLPFSPGILVGDTLYVSGEIGFDLHTGQIPKDFDAEVKACLDKLLLM